MPTGANLHALRDHNAAAVLALVRGSGRGSGSGSGADPGVSQAHLAAATGLTVQAISKIVRRLLDEGLIAASGRVTSGIGKPTTLLRLVPGSRYAIGVHLGRDRQTVLLADLAGRAVASRVRRGKLRAPDRALSAVAEDIAVLLQDIPDERVLGVGLACPGPLDHRSGVLHRVTGLPAWHGLALRDRAEAVLGRVCAVDKDTTAAALSQPGPADRAFVYLADGLGAGLVLGGRVHRGAGTDAGEFGHQVLDPDGPACRCGRRGCLEAYVLADLGRGAVDQAAARLAQGIGNLTRLLDLDEIILGGDAVLAEPEPYLAAAHAAGAPRAEIAQAGPEAVALGAAALILRPLFDP
ncbi:ROK family transcriptional regulator [Catenulispora yoronensis]|uniref:ROK family transcriptional regulator n=1 Tax=Catenulispora yoronensis TaxID=450799 RepID=A0ABN2V4G2_9ACTN